jgi:glycosyltransferase involved in cell wall biosynthesis
VISRESFCLWLVGSTGKEAARLVKAWQLTDVVNFVDYVPHAELMGYQLGTDALLLIIGAGPGSEVVLTGKIFEYLATGKPILALVPSGAACDLLTEAQAGTIVDPEDISAIAQALVQMYLGWRSGNVPASPDPVVVRRYERRHLTAQLAHLFDEFCGKFK